MSAAATHGSSRVAGRQATRRDEPPLLRVLEWSTIIPVVSTILAMSLLRDSWEHVAIGEVALWTATIALCELLPVRVGPLILTLSFPILLAAAFLLPPEIVGAIVFVGALDIRELRREVSFAHGLFNRSQLAMSTSIASVVFHSLGGDPTSWPAVLGVGMVSLVADVLVNWTLVYAGLRALEPTTVRSMIENMSAGDPIAFASAYFSYGLIAVLLALAVQTGGTSGLLAVVIPVILARQVFVRSTELRDLALLLAHKSTMLLAITGKIGDERREERLTLAADLHDDLLPPLYKVHLLGQVVRQDLATGQLLALDDDVPDLVHATEQANDTARSLIRRLRRSPIGPDGLTTTLQLLVRGLARESKSRIHASLADASGAPVVQLLAYQIAREALRNAVRHSSAENIWLRLDRDGSELRLTIEDDGVGFDPEVVDENAHFGLQLMRERVELAGGIFRLDSTLGQGTRIVVRLPGHLNR